MTDEQIAEWTTRNDIMLGPDGIDSRRMYPESVIPTAEVTAKLREMRDAHSELLAAAKAGLAFAGGWREAITELGDWCSEPVRLKNMLAAADQLDEWTMRVRAAIETEGQNA